GERLIESFECFVCLAGVAMEDTDVFEYDCDSSFIAPGSGQRECFSVIFKRLLLIAEICVTPCDVGKRDGPAVAVVFFGSKLERSQMKLEGFPIIIELGVVDADVAE